MRPARAALTALLAAGCAGHIALTKPMARTGAQPEFGGTVAFDRPAWYSDDVEIPEDQEPTNTDPMHLTLNVGLPGGPAAAVGDADDKWQRHPWRAPGTTRTVGVGCGMIARHAGAVPPGGDNDPHHKDMADLPPQKRDTWAVGSEVEVSFSIRSNHGGGYIYRICPSSQRPDQACFWNGALEFSGTKGWLQNSTIAASRTAYDAVRVAVDVPGVGRRTFTRNPVPNGGAVLPGQKGWFNISWGWGHDYLNFNVIDKVKVPDVPPGDYVLSFRYESEQTPQLWENCGDVRVVAKGAPASMPSKGSTARHRACADAVCFPHSAEVVWRHAMPGGQGVPARPVVTDDRVFVGMVGALGTWTPGLIPSFFAIDRRTGEQLWHKDLKNGVLQGATLGDGTNGKAGVIYLGVSGALVFAMNESTGADMPGWPWHSSADDLPATPTIVGQTMYQGSYDGNVFAIDLEKAATKWKVTPDGQCGNSPTATMDIDGELRVFFTCRFDRLFSVRASDGSSVWTRAGGVVYSTPVIAEGILYIGTSNGTVDAYDPKDGALLWSFDACKERAEGGCGVWADNGVTVRGGVMYFGTDDAYLYAVTAGRSGGKEVWSLALGGPVQTTPAVSNGVVHVGSFESFLHAVNASNGAPMWSHRTDLPIVGAPTVHTDGTVYVGSMDGTLHAVRGPSVHTAPSALGDAHR